LNFDITCADAAHEFFNSFMGFSSDEWIDKVMRDYNDDVDLFIENHTEQIIKNDVHSVKFIGFHITTVKDECAEIKQFGLRSLRYVLASDSDLSRFLLEKGLRFDMIGNFLIYDGKKHDVEYSRYEGNRQSPIARIARKLCYDPQVNGFFCCSNPCCYSTVHRHPEFLWNIQEWVSEQRFPSLSELGQDWATERKPYIITFSVPFEKIEWYTFYGKIEDYHADSISRIKVKKELLRWAYYRMRDSDEHCSERIIYISPKSVVEPQEIIKYECIEKPKTP